MELDLSKPLVPQVVVRNEPLKLVYEGLHAICFSCGVYGHRKESCTYRGTPMQSPEGVSEGSLGIDSKSVQQGSVGGMSEVSVAREAISMIANSSQWLINADDGLLGENQASDTQNSPFGPWMINKKVPKRKENLHKVRKSGEGPSDRVSPKMPNQSVAGSGSRFEVLEEQNEVTIPGVDEKGGAGFSGSRGYEY